MNSHLGISAILAVTVSPLIQVITNELKDKYWEQFKTILKITMEKNQKENIHIQKQLRHQNSIGRKQHV